ncbi:TIGR03086 family protein [Actinomadura barringtoniae]|uniref:TIGR03086 family protein n=1 Tax=Actinomadura barringtoniae TaxID=1427535 RepID=A0A939P650_9ACTN|nr:TIGR03086 family metal-binding protein [Actinomadura barringtoniae]MBO2445815.1 TIGR03086 family protein [Actinomadura barringtoniae]
MNPDLGSATRTLAELVAAVTDEQLALSTPCPAYTVADLLDHVDGVTLAFRMAAEKTFAPGSPPPEVDASRLGDDWRTRIPERLAALAEAWRKPDAWEGMTEAGNVTLPGAVGGRVALNEVVVHGWDIARAIGADYRVDDATAEACLAFIVPATADSDPGPDGAFGPPVEVAADAPVLDRLVGANGRDPDWQR